MSLGMKVKCCSEMQQRRQREESGSTFHTSPCHSADKYGCLEQDEKKQPKDERERERNRTSRTFHPHRQWGKEKKKVNGQMVKVGFQCHVESSKKRRHEDIHIQPKRKKEKNQEE